MALHNSVCTGLLIFLCGMTVSVNGCLSDFAGTEEKRGLSYKSFRKQMNGYGYGLENANSIDFKHVWTRDGFDTWVRAKMEPRHFATVEAWLIREFEKDGFVFHPPGPTAFKSPCSLSGLPSNWPQLPVSVPEWWSPKSNRKGRCVFADRQVDNTEYSRRANGICVFFERDASEVRIWEWSRQHFRLHDDKYKNIDRRGPDQQ